MVADATTKTKPRLQKLYEDEVRAKLMSEFGLTNVNQTPRLVKIVVNCGIGRYLENQKLKPEIRDTVIETLTTITGQKPIMVNAIKSVSELQGAGRVALGVMVHTLRRDHMWHFIDRLINLAIPVSRTSAGLKDTAFDPRGTPTRWG
jgi:large subunit ribosomal protein L5